MLRGRGGLFIVPHSCPAGPSRRERGKRGNAMPVLNSATAWGAVSKTFHWLIVLLIIVQFTLAKIADDLPLGPQKFELLKWHKSFGITILGLAILRLLWRWMNPATPVLPDTLKPWERVLARATHAALYVLLFLQPLTGWMLSTASNFPVRYFGLFTLPALVGPDKELAHLLEDVHETLAIVLVCVALLHVAGALKHHFWLKDDVLIRMLPFSSNRQR